MNVWKRCSGKKFIQFSIKYLNNQGVLVFAWKQCKETDFLFPMSHANRFQGDFIFLERHTKPIWMHNFKKKRA